MSDLPSNIDIKYKAVRVRVIGCTSSSRQCWYKPFVGKILNVDRRTCRIDGKVSYASYHMKRTPDGGFNGHLMTDDVEELSTKEEKR